MPLKDLRNLFILAAIWGSSFLLMRLAVHDFGPVALTEVRVGVSAVFLLIVSAAMGRLKPFLQNWRVIAVGGLINIGMPFLLYSYAAQTLTAGFMAIVNALAPLFAAIVARLWLGERLTRLRILGLVIGFGGIAILVSDSLSLEVQGQGLAIAASIAAPLCYGVAASYMTRYYRGLDPIACAAGSVTASALFLLPFAAITWPTQPISGVAWGAALLIALLCTGVAYLIYFKLIEDVGPGKTITVTFLVPPFGVFWGAMVLSEPVTTSVVLGAATVLLGTLLATGVIAAKPTGAARTASRKKPQ